MVDTEFQYFVSVFFSVCFLLFRWQGSNLGIQEVQKDRGGREAIFEFMTESTMEIVWVSRCLLLSWLFTDAKFPADFSPTDLSQYLQQGERNVTITEMGLHWVRFWSVHIAKLVSIPDPPDLSSTWWNLYSHKLVTSEVSRLPGANAPVPVRFPLPELLRT